MNVSSAQLRRIRVRWSVLGGLFAFAFFAYVQRTSIAVAAERMMPELGLTQVQVGWLLTAFLVSYTALQVPAGLLGQRSGARNTLVLASALALFATVGTVAAPAVFTGISLLVSLLAARLLLGIAQAPVFPVASGAIESWFPQAQWSTAQGLLNSGLNLGAASTPPLIAYLMQAQSWQAALVISSIPLLVLTVYWSWRAHDTPANDPRVSRAELNELHNNPPPPTQSLTIARVLKLLKDRDLLALTASYLSMNYVFYLLTYWCFLYFVQERHFSSMESGWLAAAPFVAAGFGAAFGGYLNDVLRRHLGDRWGFRGVPVITLPLAGIALIVAVSAPSVFFAEMALCIAFAAVEVTEGPYWAAAMRIAGADSMVATGLLNTGGNVGGILATPVIAVLSAQHGWNAAFFTGTACAIAAAALWLCVDTTRGGASQVAPAGVLPSGAL